MRFTILLYRFWHSRISFALEVILGIIFVLGLTYNGYDRAVMLIPTWTLLCIWTIGGGMTIMGHIDNDIIQPALGGGIVCSLFF